MGKTKIQSFGEESQLKEEKKKSDKGVRIPGLKGGQRVVVVGTQPVETEPLTTLNQPLSDKQPKSKKSRKHGKKYLAASAKIDPQKSYSITEAAKLVKETSKTRFLASVELHLVLLKDKINMQVDLPHSAGKSKKIEVATNETIAKLQSGKVDFDVLLATPAIMPKLVPFAKLLGPKGMMPNLKNGTLTDDPKKAAEKFGENSVNIRTEKSAPLIHIVVAKVNQPEDEIVHNIKAVINAVGAKQVKKAAISSTMGPGIRLSV